jgi:cytochrome P450
VRRLAHETLDEMTSVAPPVDLKSAFSVPFSIRTICAVLGLDYELKEVLHDFITAIEQSPPDAAAIPRALHVREEAVRTAIRAKKAEPTDDVISAFVASPDVTEDQLVGIVVFLSEAGHFTTSNLLTHGVYTLLDDREHWAAIGSDEAAAARTVEELLRHLSTVQAGASVRVATADVVIDGIMIREGEQVYVSLPAANHDPAAFPDPHRFDTGREGAHLGFSFGIHQCLGQHLARLELTVALHILAKRFPDLTIAVPREEVRPLRRTFPLNGLLELPVSWE